MRTVRPLTAVAVALATLVPAVAAETVEDVVEKHVEARGGREAWAAIESLEMTGDFTSFSKVAPFTLQLKRDRKGRFESQMSGHPFVIAYDGENAWHINDFYEIDWSWRLEEQDFIAFRQDLDLASPLFDWQERGYELELVGETEIDGIPAIGVKLTRPDGQEETWYLDPDSYLEVARESQGSDFGRPVPQQTFFDDFREVGGVMIPHFIESQFYTRHRITEVHDVAVNKELDDALFAFPIPTGMDRVAALAGTWEVKVESRSSPRQPWEESTREALIEPLARGAMLQQTYVDQDGTEVVSSLVYDRFREVYRLAAVNGFTTHLDLQEGGFDDEGRLTLSNLETGTEWTGFGRTFHGRSAIFDLSEDAFQVESEISTDGGENWILVERMTYTRKME
jgi:hypothetical protein